MPTPEQKVCPECGGKGRQPYLGLSADTMPCPTCKGTGHGSPPSDMDHPHPYTCFTCHGTGLEDQGDGVSEGVVPSPATEGTSVLSGACTEGRDHVPETAPIGPLADSDPEDQGGEGEAEAGDEVLSHPAVQEAIEEGIPEFDKWKDEVVSTPAEASGVGAEDGRVWTIRHDPDYGKSWVDGPVQKNTLDVVPRTLLTQAEGERDRALDALEHAHDTADEWEQRLRTRAETAEAQAEALATRLSAVEGLRDELREEAKRMSDSVFRQSYPAALLDAADRLTHILDSTESPTPNPEEGLREAAVLAERAISYFREPHHLNAQEECTACPVASDHLDLALDRLRTALGDGGRDE